MVFRLSRIGQVDGSAAVLLGLSKVWKATEVLKGRYWAGRLRINQSPYPRPGEKLVPRITVVYAFRLNELPDFDELARDLAVVTRREWREYERALEAEEPWVSYEVEVHRRSTAMDVSLPF